MRLLIIVFALIPGFAWSQAGPGFYILATRPHVRYKAMLKLQDDSNLLVKGNINRSVGPELASLKLDSTVAPNDAASQKSRFGPEDVSYFHIGQQRFTTASEFEIPSTGWLKKPKKLVFVELLDSGRVILMQYHYTRTGGYGLNLDNIPASVILLRRASESAPVVIPFNTITSPFGTTTSSIGKFKETVSPFLSSRPDLIAILENKKFTIEEFSKFIHAFNTGRKYELPPARLSHYEQLHQEALLKQAAKKKPAASLAVDSVRR